MAVFPDRIVLKNSTDNQATIEAAIQTGGTDEITQGEIVLGINTSSVQFYTKAGDGSIVTLGGTTISVIGDLTDVDLDTAAATDGQVLAYNSTSGNWEPADSGAIDLGSLTDVDLTTPATDGQVIAYNSTSGNWEPVDQSGGSGGGASTVVAAFAFGYINATSAGTGTEVSWGTYDAGTGNIDVTFDTARADTSYIVFTDNESADDIGASVSNKSTTGFTLSLYSFSTGNPASPAAYPLTFQVFSSDGTQQVSGGTGGLAYWGGGDFTTGTSDGQQADGGLFT